MPLINRIGHYYRYLLFTVIEVQRKIGNPAPQFGGVCTFSGILFIDLVLVALAITLSIRGKTFQIAHGPLMGMSAMALVMAWNYFLIAGKKYDRMKEEFKYSSKTKEKHGEITAIVFIGIPFVLMILLCILFPPLY